MVVKIYLDAKNPGWLTKELLDQLQNGDLGPFYSSKTHISSSRERSGSKLNTSPVIKKVANSVGAEGRMCTRSNLKSVDNRYHRGSSTDCWWKTKRKSTNQFPKWIPKRRRRRMTERE